MEPKDIEKIILIGGQDSDAARSTIHRGLHGQTSRTRARSNGMRRNGCSDTGWCNNWRSQRSSALDVTPLSLGIRNTRRGGNKNDREKHDNSYQEDSNILNCRRHANNSDNPSSPGRASNGGDNVSLGEFNLTGIPPAPRGVPQIEVSFDINAQTEFECRAKDLWNRKRTKITITASTKLGEAEKQRMIRDEEHSLSKTRKRKKRPRSEMTPTH